MRGVGGQARLGNRRSHCATCNRWARHTQQTAMRQVAWAHVDEYLAALTQAEASLFPLVSEDWRINHPVPMADIS